MPDRLSGTGTFAGESALHPKPDSLNDLGAVRRRLPADARGHPQTIHAITANRGM